MKSYLIQSEHQRLIQKRQTEFAQGTFLHDLIINLTQKIFKETTNNEL